MADDDGVHGVVANVEGKTTTIPCKAVVLAAGPAEASATPTYRSKQTRKLTMNTTQNTLAKAAAMCITALALSSGAIAQDKPAYDQAKASAKATYDAEHKQCGALAGNAKDICVEEAKARRVGTEANAEAAYKGTPEARAEAAKDIAEANYDVAKERCDDKGGNAKDVCVKEAKAALEKSKADAKAGMKVSEARHDAAKDKMDADYKVAKEKCDTLAGDAKDSCVAQAKMTYKQ